MRYKKTVLGVTAVAVLASGGIAVAAWTVNGSGQGEGVAAIASNLHVTASMPSNATMYPGGPAAPVQFTVDNPNPFPITISGYQWGTPTSTQVTICQTSQISLDANAPTTASISLPANAAATTVSVPGVLDLAHSASNGCQGVAFVIPLTVTAVQQ